MECFQSFPVASRFVFMPWTWELWWKQTKEVLGAAQKYRAFDILTLLLQLMQDRGNPGKSGEAVRPVKDQYGSIRSADVRAWCQCGTQWHDCDMVWWLSNGGLFLFVGFAGKERTGAEKPPSPGLIMCARIFDRHLGLGGQAGGIGQAFRSGVIWKIDCECLALNRLMRAALHHRMVLILPYYSFDNFEMSGYCGNFVTQTDDTSLAAESWSEPAKTAKVREALFCLEKPRKTHEKSGIWSFAKPASSAELNPSSRRLLQRFRSPGHWESVKVLCQWGDMDEAAILETLSAYGFLAAKCIDQSWQLPH